MTHDEVMARVAEERDIAAQGLAQARAALAVLAELVAPEYMDLYRRLGALAGNAYGLQNGMLEALRDLGEAMKQPGPPCLGNEAEPGARDGKVLYLRAASMRPATWQDAPFMPYHGSARARYEAMRRSGVSRDDAVKVRRYASYLAAQNGKQRVTVWEWDAAATAFREGRLGQ